MAEPIIRLAEEADIEQLIEMRREFTFEDLDPNTSVSEPGYEDECRRFLKNALAGRRWQIWVAELDGRILAHAFVALIDKVPRPIRESARIAYLTNVYTRPDARRQGIGTRIIRRAQEAAHEADVELMIVWPSEKSIEFYVRGGFEAPGDPLVWRAKS
jgi:GNAT superfamily N-acetyltransferase